MVDGSIRCVYPSYCWFADGTSVKLEAVPAPDYEFVNWEVNDTPSGSQNPTTIQMTCYKDVTAHFTLINQITYTLTVDISPTDSGMVTLDPSQPAEGYALGTEVTLTADASEGCEFDHWSGDLSGSENPTKIQMTCVKTVTANFTQITYSLTVNVSPEGKGTVTLDPSPPAGGYVVGTEVTLTVGASEGYEFDHWEVNGALSGSESPTIITMDSNKEVTAYFTQVTYTLTTNVSPTGGGTVTLEPSQPDGGYVAGTEVTLTADASEGYEFDHWSGDLSDSENQTTIIMDSDKMVTAHFNQITYNLTVDVSLGDGGDIEVNGTLPSSYPDSYTLAQGASVDLRAVPAPGYKFDHWSVGDLSSSENTITITMDSSKEVTAYFTEVTPSSFPWWWLVVGVGVVVIGLLFYFLVVRGIQA